ncbi:MAG: hypothetical protein WC882_03070 [Candidatus Gracilibacteria bacterium]
MSETASSSSYLETPKGQIGHRAVQEALKAYGLPPNADPFLVEATFGPLVLGVTIAVDNLFLDLQEHLDGPQYEFPDSVDSFDLSGILSGADLDALSREEVVAQLTRFTNSDSLIVELSPVSGQLVIREPDSERGFVLLKLSCVPLRYSPASQMALQEIEAKYPILKELMAQIDQWRNEKRPIALNGTNPLTMVVNHEGQLPKPVLPPVDIDIAFPEYTPLSRLKARFLDLLSKMY